MDRKVFIYRILNKITEQCYVGSTIDLIRLARHRNWLETKTHFNQKLQNAWNKYGAESFIFETLDSCLESNRNYYEAFFMAKFQSIENG
jgi:group I intron endonuclease